jgi:hypothetical protein
MEILLFMKLFVKLRGIFLWASFPVCINILDCLSILLELLLVY